MPPPGRNITSELADMLVAQSVNLQDFEAGLASRSRAFMKDLEEELVADIAKIDPTAPVRNRYKRERLDTLLVQTRGTIGTHYSEISKHHKEQMSGLAKATAKGTKDAVNSVLRGNVATVALTPEQLKSIVNSTLTEGAPSAKWWRGQDSATQDRFAAEMRKGMARGEGVPDLIKRVRGASTGKRTVVVNAKGKRKVIHEFKGGFMDKTTREAEALVRTTTQNIANTAKIETYKANQDVLNDICKGLDGLTWDFEGNPIGHDKQFPGATAHWQCRSTQVPLIKPWDDIAEDQPPPVVWATGQDVNLATPTSKSVQGRRDTTIAWMRPADLFQKTAINNRLFKSKDDNLIPGRIPQIEKRIAEGQPLNPPEIVMSEGRPGMIDWVDGRHSTRAAWQDGHEYIPVVIPKKDLSKFKSQLDAKEANPAEWKLKQKVREIPLSTRAAMTGAVSEVFTYEDWLRRRPESVQKEILGIGRWKMWNDGRISFTDLTSRNNTPKTLGQLEEAFAKSATSGYNVPKVGVLILTEGATPAEQLNIWMSGDNRIGVRRWLSSNEDKFGTVPNKKMIKAIHRKFAKKGDTVKIKPPKIKQPGEENSAEPGLVDSIVKAGA